MRHSTPAHAMPRRNPRRSCRCPNLRYARILTALHRHRLDIVAHACEPDPRGYRARTAPDQGRMKTHTETAAVAVAGNSACRPGGNESQGWPIAFWRSIEIPPSVDRTPKLFHRPVSHCGRKMEHRIWRSVMRRMAGHPLYRSGTMEAVVIAPDATHTFTRSDSYAFPDMRP